jgi:thiol:disulfide interchange protein
LTAELGEKLRAWAGAAAFGILIWIVMFGGWFQGRGEELSWRPFTQTVFEEQIATDNTVLVDFTADWCLTCKTMEKFVLNTGEIRKAVDANRVVTLKADWTRGDKDVTDMLESLGSKQVPVLAVFPAGRADKPIVLRGGYTKQTVLDALANAGPSKPAEPAPRGGGARAVNILGADAAKGDLHW